MALAFIVAFLPSYLIRFKIGFLPMTLLELMILILFVIWLIKKKEKWNLSHFKYPIIFWLVAATIAVFVSPDWWPALGIWKAYFIEPILFFIVFINVVKTTGSFAGAQDDIGLNLIFRALGFSALYISLFAIWQKITGQGILSLQSWQGEKILRATSIFEYPNAVGLFLAPLILIFIGQKKQKIFYWLVAFLSLMAIIFAQSEGAIAGILAGLIFIGLAIKSARKFTLAGLFISMIIIFSFAPLKNYLWQKASLNDFSGQIRKEMWSETWQMLKEKPIFGAGLAGYQKAVEPYHKKDYIEIYLYPHNIFFNFWSELGIIGLFVFLWLVFKFFRLGFKSKSSFFIMAAMIAILVHGLVDVPYFKNDLSVLFWLIIGLMQISSNQEDKKIPIV
ncbi:MAG: O-antigen polymerase [Parcubacteria group bacterium Athens0714_12]|nr:MAG: O-antigen polymerase [Parcubacteria group bacterium Athens0714_12]